MARQPRRPRKPRARSIVLNARTDQDDAVVETLNVADHVVRPIATIVRSDEVLPVPMVIGGEIGGASQVLRDALKSHAPSVDRLVGHVAKLMNAERWIGGRSPIRTEDNPTRLAAGQAMLELYRSAGLLPPLRTAQASSAPRVKVSLELGGGKAMVVEVGGEQESPTG